MYKSRYTKKISENEIQCEKCSNIMFLDDAYIHEFYQDKKLTIFL